MGDYITPVQPRKLWSSHIHRVQTRSHLSGAVWRDLIFFTTERSHYARLSPISGDKSCLVGPPGEVSASVHTMGEVTTTSILMMKTAVWYQLQARGHSDRRGQPPNPRCFAGPRGQVPSSVQTTDLPGKVLISRTFPDNQDLVWTQGHSKNKCYRIWITLI